MVGALADWFAVTALFRHPLGLPIPHTAIIPRKKDQIGASLGTFVQENFLTRSVVETKLTTIDVPGRLGGFLAAPGRAERLAGDAAAAVTALSELLRDEDLQPAVADLVDRKLHATPAAPAVARVLELVVEGDRHQEVMSAALRGLARFLQENRLVFRAQLGDASPAWVPDWVDDRVFDRVFAGPAGVPRRGRRRSAARAAALLRRPAARLRARAAHRPGHRGPGRGPEEGAARAPRRPDLVGVAVDQRQERRPDRGRRPGLRAAGPPRRVHPGRRPAAADTTRPSASSCSGTRTASPATSSSGSPATSPTWSAARSPAGTPRRPASRIELQVGRDLQWIRVNGTVVGGLAGLVIYTVAQLHRLAIVIRSPDQVGPRSPSTVRLGHERSGHLIDTAVSAGRPPRRRGRCRRRR